jgi:hypothetical protein
MIMEIDKDHKGYFLVEDLVSFGGGDPTQRLPKNDNDNKDAFVTKISKGMFRNIKELIEKSEPNFKPLSW